MNKLLLTGMKRIRLSKSPIFLIAGLLVLACTSCEKLLMEPNPANNPVENFELLWKSVDEKYSFFALKDINWRAVHDKYRPLVQEGMSQEDLFKVMADMLYELRDGHVNLVSNFNVSRNWDWYLDYPPNYNENIIERNYLGRDYQIAGPFRTKVINEVGYIRYSSFMQPIDPDVLDPLLKKYAHLKGIIIDIRNNPGGSIALVDVLASRFVEQKTLVGYTRYKEGPSHEDFTKAFPEYLEPEGTAFTKPVVVLTNRQVYSAANLFASFMAQLPQVTLIGDQTGGGGGAPYSGELMNGWQYIFSVTQMLNPQMGQIEMGVVPDIQVDLSAGDEAAGKDTILERAILFLQ